VHSLLSVLPLQTLAHASGFFRRSPRKLSLEAFVQSLLWSLCSSHYSLHHWAAQLSALQTKLFSKQALHRRCNQRLLDFLHLTLGAVLGHWSRADCPTEFLGRFKRVLLHDSTVLKLHPSLAQYFPGCGNQCSTPMAGLRIQAIFDLCSQRWIHFQLGAAKDNDQKDSALVLDYLQAGDLVIRDLGYAVLRVWRQIIGQGAYFLSRWRNDLKLFDPRTNQPVDLLALLKEHPKLCSLELLVGAQERLALRLVALRLPAQVAAQRRRRAKDKARRDRSLSPPSQRYLQLLDWSILLTNVPAHHATAQQLLEAYGARWQIELLFKSWKSHFQIGQLPRSNPLWVQIQLATKLLAIALLQNHFNPRLQTKDGKALSPLKIAAYLCRLLPLITTSPHRPWLEHFLYFCRYDSRHRPNFFQKIAGLC
jgi:Transposase DDE domain